MKYIFLDEFVWINIRRSILNENSAKDLRKVIELIERKSKNEEWVFPILAEHLSETHNTGDKVKRLTLAFIMAEISKGYTILQFSRLKDFEISMMLQGKQLELYRENVIKRDIMNIWGKSSQDIFKDTCKEEGITKDSVLYDRAWQIYSMYTANRHSMVISMIDPQFISDKKKEMLGQILDNLKREDIAEPYVFEEQFMVYTLKQYYSEEQQHIILAAC